jgi:opacity protein-like surface antigen
VKIAATTLAIMAALCLSAHGQTRQKPAQPSHFYLYGEYDYYTDSSKLKGGGVGLGWNFNRYLGVQAGAQFLNSNIQNIGNSGFDRSDNTTIFYGEAKLSLPVTESFSVYGTAGVANGETDVVFISPSTYPNGISGSIDATGYRIGVGAEYWITRHVGLRASWHQQNVGGVLSDIGAGLSFRF